MKNLAYTMGMVGAVVVLLSGCAAQSSGSPSMTDRSPAERNEIVLRSVAAQIDGTIPQRVASEYLIYSGLQSRLAACMKAAGLRYLPPAFENVNAGLTTVPLPSPFPEAADVDTAWARTHGFGEGDRYAAVWTARTGGPSPDAGKPMFGTELDRCGRAASAFPSIPGFARQLDSQLADLIASTLTTSHVRQPAAAYDSCLATQGVTAGSRDVLVAAVDVRYGDLGPSDPGWEAAHAFEIKAALADAHCRAGAHRRYLQVIGPALLNFQAAHGEELRAAGAQWTGLVAKAAKAQDRFRAEHRADPAVRNSPVVTFG